MQVLQAQILVVARVQVETDSRLTNVALVVCGAVRGARARHRSRVAVAQKNVLFLFCACQLNAKFLRASTVPIPGTPTAVPVGGQYEASRR